MSIWFASPIEHDPVSPIATTPTATNVLTGFPASSLLTFDPTQVFATSSATSTITWDLGTTRQFDVVSLIHSNATHGHGWGLEISTDNVNWTVLVGPGTNTQFLANHNGNVDQTKKHMLRRNHSLYSGATVQSARYIRLHLNTFGGADYTIGRLFVGLKFKPSTNWQYGSQFNFLDPSLKERTDRGALLVDRRDTVVAATVKMEFLSKAEMYDYVYEFNYWRGASREILACLDAEDTVRLQKNLLYCTIVDGRQISFDSFNTHSASWILESIA